MALRWTSALSVGVLELDLQHQELFDRLDRLHGAMLAHDRAESVRMLRFLREYTQFHLAAEERLMEAMGYPARAEHEAEHTTFAKAVADLSRKLDEEGVSAAFVHAVDRQVTRWLTEHFYSTDLALGFYVRGRRGAEAR